MTRHYYTSAAISSTTHRRIIVSSECCPYHNFRHLIWDNLPNEQVYQNVTNLTTMATDDLLTNLFYQLTAPVKWTLSIQEMIADGATVFIEVGS